MSVGGAERAPRRGNTASWAETSTPCRLLGEGGGGEGWGARGVGQEGGGRREEGGGQREEGGGGKGAA